MIRDFEYLIVFTSAPGVLPEQNYRYRIQPWKVNEIKAYNENYLHSVAKTLISSNSGRGCCSKLPQGSSVTNGLPNLHFVAKNIWLVVTKVWLKCHFLKNTRYTVFNRQ